VKVSFVSQPTTIEPLGIMYLSAALKQSGHGASIGTDGDILAASIMPGSDGILDILKKEKNGRKIVVGGSDPTYNPEKYELPWIDGVCRGDGEEAIVDFVNGEWTGTVIGRLTGKWPRPDRKIVYDAYPVHRYNPIRHFMLSRGCPYDCSYCFNHSYRELYKGHNVLRNPDPHDAIDEILETKGNYGCEFVYFQDDTFNLKESFMYPFLTLYKDKVHIPFHCHLRAELVNEEQVMVLADSGCYSARFAIEIAGDKKQTLLNRGKITDADCIEAARLLNKYGIKVMTQNIIGLPDTTLTDDYETLKLNQECFPAYAWASIYQPYKGTRLGDYCYEKGLVESEPGRFFEGSPLKMEDKGLREHFQKNFSLFATEPDPGEWIYSRYREEREKMLYGGIKHQGGVYARG
jgi:anaerobic magnesium-protoporphyrin IX monomethyl ester cyclase